MPRLKAPSDLGVAPDLCSESADLLHLLTCSSCRRRAVRKLLGEIKADEDDTLECFEEAEHLLRSVLCKLVEEKSLAEAALAGLNLCGLLVETGRPAEIEQIAAVLDPRVSAHPAFSRVARNIGYWPGIQAHDSPSALRDHVRMLGSHLLRGFRRKGCGIKPLPFL